MAKNERSGATQKGDYVWIMDCGAPTQALVVGARKVKKTKKREARDEVLLHWMQRCDAGYINRRDWLPIDRCWKVTEETAPNEK